MHLLSKSFCNIKQNVYKLDSILNNQQRSYRIRPERPKWIKASVVGSGSFGDPASLIVRTSESFKTLFNCGEGTFRILYSRSHRFRSFSNVFCTSNRWERIGGIPSLGRAVFDRNSHFPTIHGPQQIENCLNTFAALTDIEPELAVSDRTFNQNTYYEDNHMQVDFVDLIRENAPTTEIPSVKAYVCRLIPRGGTVMLSKFTEDQIPVEYIKNISKGEDVTLPDGRSIIAKDFISPGFEGGNFLVIDVPSKEYLPDLERNELLNGHIDEINSNIGMEFVAHFTPSSLTDTPEYQKFMRRINAKQHLALNDCNSYSGLRQVHKMQHTLSNLDTDIYPPLCSKYTRARQTYTSLDQRLTSSNESEPIVIEPTVSGTRYIFPLNGRISDKELIDVRDDDDEEIESSSEDDETDDETELNTTITRANSFPKMVFFGTGSTFPGITKTTTSILVHTAHDTSIMLDCGEGTVGQICRFYGSRTEDVIRNIKALHITHMHGDHHMGIMDFIRIRQKYMPENRPPLLLMSPLEEFTEVLKFYEKNFGNVLSEFIIIDNEDLVNSGLSEEQKILLKINDLKTCRVPHLPRSYAISIKSNILPENKEEFKLTFSGDTIPCESLVELGNDSTLLIHEATLEDTLTSSAAMKMHSTISQAIEQGIKMNAKNTILTHFSQRYKILPPIDDELIKDKNIGIAFDNMEIVPSDLGKLNDLYFKVKEIYADEMIRVEKRSKKYALRNDVNIMME